MGGARWPSGRRDEGERPLHELVRHVFLKEMARIREQVMGLALCAGHLRDDPLVTSSPGKAGGIQVTRSKRD